MRTNFKRALTLLLAVLMLVTVVFADADNTVDTYDNEVTITLNKDSPYLPDTLSGSFSIEKDSSLTYEEYNNHLPTTAKSYGNYNYAVFLDWAKQPSGDFDPVYPYKTTFTENVELYPRYFKTSGQVRKITFKDLGKEFWSFYLPTKDGKGTYDAEGAFENKTPPVFSEDLGLYGNVWITDDDTPTPSTSYESGIFEEDTTFNLEWKIELEWNNHGDKSKENIYTKGKQIIENSLPEIEGYMWVTEDGDEPDYNEVYKKEAPPSKLFLVPAPPYTITFDLDYECNEKLTTQDTDDSGKLKDDLPTPTREGYDFKGWFTARNGGGKEVTKDTEFTGDTTIYAHWEETKETPGTGFTITLDPNYTGSKTRNETTNGDGYLDETKLSPPEQRDGWTFVDWYKTADSDDDDVDDKVTTATKFTEDTTIFAHWTKNPPYTITFDLNYEGSEELPTQDTDNSGKLTSLPSEPERKGWTFDGWYTLAEGGVRVDEDYPFEGDTTIYAHWTKETTETGFTITFNANGGTVSPTSGTTDKDGKLTGKLPTPTRSGYTFDGWYTAASGGTPVTTDTEFKEDTTIYAHWTEVPPFTIKFNANGGTVSSTSGTTNESGYLSSLPTPTRSGYTFVGWYTAASGGKEVTTKTKFTESCTIYAHWTKETTETGFTITFNANGGIVSPTSGTTDKDGKLSSLPMPTRSGYTFVGWYTAASGGEKVDKGYPFDGDTTIYAHWKKNSIDWGAIFPSYNVQNGTSSSGSGSWTSDKSSAKKGDTVTVTAAPKNGYVVDRVTVTDASGNTVTVTKNANGTYSFTMPGSKVTVAVTFKATAVTPAVTFKDVAAGQYYTDAVAWAAAKGITTGTGDGTTFSPNDSCTRAQIVTFLWRANGSPKVSGTTSFSDVASNAYYYDAVAWAAAKGITTGTGDGTTFSPDEPCTRAQAVTFLHRAEGTPSASGSSFIDVVSDSYYEAAVKWAVANNVTEGTGNGKFSPNDTCTRGQIVTFLYRDMA